MVEDSRFEHTQIPSWDSLEHRDCLHTSKHMMQQTTEVCSQITGRGIKSVSPRKMLSPQNTTKHDLAYARGNISQRLKYFLIPCSWLAATQHPRMQKRRLTLYTTVSTQNILTHRTEALTLQRIPSHYSVHMSQILLMVR